MSVWPIDGIAGPEFPYGVLKSKERAAKNDYKAGFHKCRFKSISLIKIQILVTQSVTL